MFPVIQLGPLAIQAPGLMWLLGVWLGLSLAERSARYFKTDANQLYNLVFAGLLAGVITARLAFIARYPTAFEDLGSIFSLSPQLLDPWGGLAGALLASIIYAQRKQLQLWPTLDALSPGLAVLAIFWHLSDLASGAGFGSLSTLPWAIELWGGTRHPSQIYEALAALIIWIGLQRKIAAQGSTISGLSFLSFVAWSAAARLLLETFHGDSFLLPGGIRLVQVAAWLLLALTLKLISDRKRRYTAGVLPAV